MYYFTSDLHFGTDQILERENRPFNNISEFENFFINEVNDKCTPDDILNIIGDYINYNDMNKADNDKTFNLVKKINCKVILYIGNNEERIIKELFENDLEKFKQYCKNKGFFDVKKDNYINFDGKTFYLNHYPRNHKDNCINLFGHVHRSSGICKSFGLNVGIDCNWGQIWSEKDILKELEKYHKYYKIDKDFLIN